MTAVRVNNYRDFQHLVAASDRVFYFFDKRDSVFSVRSERHIQRLGRHYELHRLAQDLSRRLPHGDTAGWCVDHFA